MKGYNLMKSDKNKPPWNSSHSYNYKKSFGQRNCLNKLLKMPQKEISQAREMGVEKVVDYVEQNTVSLGRRGSKSGYL